MLTFLRKIRKSLVESGSARKYILYAIGEIALVVIGILIALSINNWNENNQLRTTEIKLLSELYQDLFETEEIFTRLIEWDKKIIESKKVIIEVIERDIPWHDSLQSHFNLFNFWNTYTIKSTAYNAIENWGINNISNDSLRRQIVQIFQDNKNILDRNLHEEREIQLGTYNDIITTQLDWDNIDEVHPVNYQTFLANKELAIRLKAFKTFTYLGVGIRQFILDDIVETKKNIKIEIKRLAKDPFLSN